MLIIDKNHTIESVSEDVLISLRRQRNEVVGKKCYQIVHGMDYPPSFCPIVSAKNGAQGVATYGRLGQQPAVHCTPLADEHGNILKVIALAGEKGQVLSYEDLVLESDFRLAEVMDAIPHAMLLTDTVGTVTNANTGAVKAFGLDSKTQIVDKRIYEFVSPADRHAFHEDWRKTLADGKIERAEYMFINATGTNFPGTLFTSVLKDSSGAAIGVILGVSNITQWRELQEALRFSEAVMRSVKEGVVAWNAEYSVVYWNQACEELFGVAASEAIGKRIDDVAGALGGCTVEHPDKFFPAANRNYFAGEVQVNTRKIQRWIYAEVFPMDLYGQQRGWVAVVTDITENKKLVERANIFDAAVTSSITPIAIADLNGRVTYGNDAFLKLWGYADSEELIGRSVIEFWQTADKGEQAMKCLRDTGRWDGELAGTRKDGIAIEVQMAASMVSDKNGHPICMMASLVDITELKKSRVTLQDSQAFISGLVENSHHPILVINPDTSVRYVNPALEKLTGYAATELVGTKAPYPWSVQESMPRTVGEFRVAMRHGPEWHKELYRKKSGEYFWVEVASAPVMKQGILNYYMVNWVDITDSHLVEEELIKERDRQKAYLDTVGVILATVDSRGTITMINKKGSETLGYTERELFGQNWHTFLVPQMFRKEVRKIFRTLFSQVSPNGAKHYESVLMTKNGEEKLFAFTHTLIRVPGKKAAQILISAEDTTELHKTREQVEHSHLLASLGEMTAGIAHEVNNPLGSILLYSELLLASDVPPQVKKDLKIIHEEAKRATKIMTDLLIYGRRTKPQVRRVNLNGLVKKVLEMRRYQHKVQNIKVTVQLADAPLYVKGDSSQLMQVFMNIVLNAEDALREHKGGSIIVNTQANTRWAKVLISDDGPGIPEDLINQIFYPFFTTKPIGEGTGLGLSICYGIVTAHNGLIRAENNTMGGATFVVELPLLTHRAGKMGNGNGKKNYNADKRKDGKIVDRK